VLIALGSTSVLQYYSFLGPQNKKFQNMKKTPHIFNCFLQNIGRPNCYSNSRNKCTKFQPKPTINFWAL